MLLKRVYDKGKVSHVRVLRAGRVQKFSTKFIEQQLGSGLLSIGQGKVTIRTAPEESDLVYQIVREPGLYCCHCEQKQGDSQEAQKHVAGHKEPSPSPENPAGYRKDNFYLCERVSGGSEQDGTINWLKKWFKGEKNG
jgi:hypothetical protein